MPEFFNVLAPDDAIEVVRNRLTVQVETEAVDTADSLGRVTAESITSSEDLPAYPRSAMDGFSVRARDTFGATEGLPAYLEVVGDVPTGTVPDVTLAQGQAATAFTGGMLAGEADAVVMVENTQRVDGHTIEVVRPAAPGENVIQTGEDVVTGDPVLPAGHVLRPQDIGGLLALGIHRVSVARRPRVAIVSTGDEVVPPVETPLAGKIRDINTYTISALVERAGGLPAPIALVGDDFDEQRAAAVRGLAAADILVFSAGSSVSSRDMTASVIGSLGSPGVLVHGISIKPGKPTVFGMVDGTAAFGLPGNPVSAMVVFDILVRPAIYWLSGCAEPPQRASVEASFSGTSRRRRAARITYRSGLLPRTGRSTQTRYSGSRISSTPWFGPTAASRFRWTGADCTPGTG